MSINLQIPPSVIHHIEHCPTDRPVVLLLRHSARDPLSPKNVGYTLPITERGRELAVTLGKRLGKRLKTLHTSPLARCVQTAEALRDGAGVDVNICSDRYLGDPGVYVIDGRRAWKHWQKLGNKKVVEHLMTNDEALSGMARPKEAARFLVHHMLAASGPAPGVHVFVTHDALVTTTAARILKQHLPREDSPAFLEGAFFWADGQKISTAYRGWETPDLPGPLCSLTPNDVIEFAQREIAATVGLNSGARFFLAGGAFKTLLNGRPPRDLDLWATSTDDRKKLIEALHKRKAQRLESPPFADAFMLNGRVVEIPHKVTPQTLEERLGLFDIALSAVGVEHIPGGHWRAVINPLALESVRLRQVLLLKPLINWKYALATLERAHRYAEELGFSVPAEEEQEVWRVFERQPEEMRAGMLERYHRVAGKNADTLKAVQTRVGKGRHP